MVCAKLNEELIFIFLTGITIGFILNVLICEEPINSNVHIIGVNVQKIRILCILNVMPKNNSINSSQNLHPSHIWHRHCDKLIFDEVTKKTIDSSYILSKQTLLHIHKYFRNDFDWVFKIDDDSFVIAENLRFLLSAFSPDDQIYFGYGS